MISILNFEKQAGRRISMYLIHKATEHHLDQAQCKLVVNCMDRLAIHLYSGNQCIESLQPKMIADFFGKDFEDEKSELIIEYILNHAKQYKVDCKEVNIVICENKKEVGAFLFHQGKYLEKLSLVEILSLL